LKHDGDVARGRKIFGDLSSVACMKCHRVAGEGGEVGPDLTTAGAQFGRTELAESVLFPSKAIREGYQRVEVETKNEETFEGLLIAETNERLNWSDARRSVHKTVKHVSTRCTWNCRDEITCVAARRHGEIRLRTGAR